MMKWLRKKLERTVRWDNKGDVDAAEKLTSLLVLLRVSDCGTRYFSAFGRSAWYRGTR